MRFDNLQFLYDFYSAWIELLTEVELVKNIDKTSLSNLNIIIKLTGQTSLSYLYRIIAWN